MKATALIELLLNVVREEGDVDVFIVDNFDPTMPREPDFEMYPGKSGDPMMICPKCKRLDTRPPEIDGVMECMMCHSGILIPFEGLVL